MAPSLYAIMVTTSEGLVDILEALKKAVLLELSTGARSELLQCISTVENILEDVDGYKTTIHRTVPQG